jgi:hypothetical protein
MCDKSEGHLGRKNRINLVFVYCSTTVLSVYNFPSNLIANEVTCSTNSPASRLLYCLSVYLPNSLRPLSR